VVFLEPASAWGMIASRPGQNSWRVGEKENFSLFLGTQVSSESGDMTYTIQGPEDGGWKSELIWPLDGIFYAGGIVSATIGQRFHLNLGAWKSLNEDAGTMEDSDWFESLSDLLYFLYGDSKAIYGEFNSTVDVIKMDINARYDVLRRTNLTLGPMLGYSHKSLEWAAGDGYQRSPIPRYNVGRVSGTGILYEETLKVPYVGVAASLLPGGASFGINVYTLYSPIAQCDDIDDHVKRYKKSTGHTEGTFLSVGTDLYWIFSQSWSLTGQINYTKYDLEGEQDQEFYAGENLGVRFDDIDLTVEGSQLSFGVMFGYSL
jgi:outer membrane protease